MDLEEILHYAGIPVSTKQELLLRLCALNLLNALVKQEEYKGKLNYGMIKPKVFYLIKNLASRDQLGLSDEIYIKPSENCAYIRCYCLQFGFHNINAKALEEEFPYLTNEGGQWDGVRLQPIADTLYNWAKEVETQNQDEQTIKDKLQFIINSNIQ